MGKVFSTSGGFTPLIFPMQDWASVPCMSIGQCINY